MSPSLTLDGQVVTALHAHEPAAWGHLLPLVATAAFFLAGIGLVNRDEPRRVDGVHRFRWPVLGLLFVASMAHVPVIPTHLDEAPYMGVLFIAFSIAAFGLASALAWRSAAVLYPAAGALCAAAILAYAATRLVAFPRLADDVGAWLEPLGIVSVLAEAGVVALVCVALRPTRPRRSAPHGQPTAAP
jgi:hypothetical protein